jgi:hypothetical protein
MRWGVAVAAIIMVATVAMAEDAGAWPPAITATAGLSWRNDRVHQNYGEMFALASAHFNNAISLRLAYLFDNTAYFQEHTISTDTAYSLQALPLWALQPFSIGVRYLYNTINQYSTRSNSLIPYIAFTTRYFTAQAGAHWKWTSFFTESPILEGNIALSVSVIPLRVGKWTAGITIANFDPLYAPNFWDFYLRCFTTYNIRPGMTACVGLFLYQTGLDGFTVRFYGAKLRGAITVTL